MYISVETATAELEALGHRVRAASAKGLTAQQAPAGEEDSTPGTKAHHRDPCIIGTAGMKTASLSQQGAQAALVGMEQKKDQPGQWIHEVRTDLGV
jgi:hypothetical protein